MFWVVDFIAENLREIKSLIAENERHDGMQLTVVIGSRIFAAVKVSIRARIRWQEFRKFKVELEFLVI